MDIKQKAREMFDDKFGKKGKEGNCDSIGRQAGCDDCTIDVNTREEHRTFIDQIIDLTIAEERKNILDKIERVYPKTFITICNDDVTAFLEYGKQEETFIRRLNQDELNMLYSIINLINK